MGLTLKSAKREVTVPVSEAPLLEQVRDAGLPLEAACGGKGICGRCAVFLEEGRYRVCDESIAIEPGERREELACMTCVEGDEARVVIPTVSALDEEGASIEQEIALPPHEERPLLRRVIVELREAGSGPSNTHADRLREALREQGFDVASPDHGMLARLSNLATRSKRSLEVVVEQAPGLSRVIDVRPNEDSTGPLLGLAVDIGTTTVVVAAMDLASGHVMGRVSRFNQQILRGDDVGARMAQCEDEAGVRMMKNLIVAKTINPLVKDLAKILACDIDDFKIMVMAGNTVMQHLFLGWSPRSIGAVPFTPVAREYPRCTAQSVGLAMLPSAPVYLVPAVAGYVGGDIVADLLVEDPARDGGTRLLVDIGTNGEMILAHEGRLLACATAAGPAFEGGGLMQGCRAVQGAIDKLEVAPDDSMTWSSIGNAPPIGFCGSAIIDFIASARRSDLLNLMGRFDIERLREAGCLMALPLRHSSVHACRVVAADESGLGEELLITEPDIEQVLKAKGAIYAGMKTLLAQVGLHPRDLDGVVLAGGFARHLNIEHAIEVGLLPKLPLDRYTVIGNGSLTGAALTLLDSTQLDAARKIIDRPEVVELNLTKEFANFFAEALALPYLEPDEFE